MHPKPNKWHNIKYLVNVFRFKIFYDPAKLHGLLKCFCINVKRCNVDICFNNLLSAVNPLCNKMLKCKIK